MASRDTSAFGRPGTVSTRMAKKIVVVVCSGVCNRMFVIASALRIREKYGHELTVFWAERTGRQGLPYVGTECSDWDDYFEPIPGVATFGIEKTIKFQDKPVALSQEKFERGSVQTAAKGAKFVWADVERIKYATAPKVVDPENPLILVLRETKPFGTSSDPMEMHLSYPTTPRVYKKDAYLRDLSRMAQKLCPKNAQQVRHTLQKFAKFDTVWGIQIRGTDLRRRTTIDRKAAIAAIYKRAPRTTGFFVAADTLLPWVDKIFATEPERLLMYDNPAKFENSVEGTQHALVDLYALAQCDKLFGSSGSSFSAMAWILSDLEEFEIHS